MDVDCDWWWMSEWWSKIKVQIPGDSILRPFVLYIDTISYAKSSDFNARARWQGARPTRRWNRLRVSAITKRGRGRGRHQTTHSNVSLSITTSLPRYTSKVRSKEKEVVWFLPEYTDYVYKRWLIRDGRQIFENFKRWGLAFWMKLRDVRPKLSRKFKRCIAYMHENIELCLLEMLWAIPSTTKWVHVYLVMIVMMTKYWNKRWPCQISS